MKFLLIIAPLSLVVALLALEAPAPPETVKMLGKERTVEIHSNGMRSVDLSDTPLSIMATRTIDGRSESRCVGSLAEKEAFENSITPGHISDR